MYLDNKVTDLAAKATDPALKAFLDGVVEVLVAGRQAAKVGALPKLSNPKGDTAESMAAGHEMGLAILLATTF